MGVGGRVLVGIFGRNGHQLSAEEIWEAGGVLLGECDKTVEKDGDKGKEGRKGERGRDVTLNERRHDVRVYDTLEDMLEEREIELVSVCGSPRSGQAKVIKRVLEAGKHVYAEKPCVMNEHDMDELLELAAARNLIFCEMAGIYYEEPYFTAGKLVREGAVGEVVQVVAQKSYPYAD